MTQKTPGGSLIAPNKKARHLYEILDTLEAGLVLTGTEVKSLRAGQVSINGGGGDLIALDRQEIAGEGQSRSAAQAVAAEAGIPVVAVATLGDLLAFADGSAALADERARLQAYRRQYGVSGNDS